MFIEFFLWYVLIGIVLCIFELLFLSFFLLPIGIAAILTGIVALFIFPFQWHIFSFIFFSIVLLYFISKWKKSKFLRQSDRPIVFGLIGQTGVMVENFKSPENSGKVKIFSDIWDIYYDKKDENFLINLQIGDTVKVTEVHGNKICVIKI